MLISGEQTLESSKDIVILTCSRNFEDHPQDTS